MPARHGTIQAPDSQGWRVDTQHDLGYGCVGYWSANTTGGSGLYLPDLSGQNNHGLLVNGPTWVAGAQGGEWALRWGGTNQWVNCGTDPSVSQPGDLTVVALVNWNAATSYPYVIASKSGGSSSSTAWEIRVSAATTLQFLATDGGARIASSSFVAGIPQYVAGVIRGNVMSCYVNGVLGATTATLTGTRSTTTEPVVIGCRQVTTGGIYPWRGTVEHCLLFDRAFSTEDVARITREPSAMLWQPGRKTYWYATAGTAHTKTFTETATMSDTMNRGLGRTLAETMTMTDTLSREKLLVLGVTLLRQGFDVALVRDVIGVDLTRDALNLLGGNR